MGLRSCGILRRRKSQRRICAAIVALSLMLLVTSVNQKTSEGVKSGKGAKGAKGARGSPDFQSRLSANRIPSKEYDSSNDTTRCKNTTIRRGNIIIHGKYRGGSTFCSEFFMRHKSIAYIFEPLINDSIGGGTVSNVREVLDSVLDCRLNAGTQHALREVDRKWYRRHAFCIMPHQTPGCKYPDSRMYVGRIKPNEAESHCRKMPHKALKLIRLPSLHIIRDLIEEGTKVVHLVRDPRGVMQSRSKLDAHFNYTIDSDIYCKEVVTDLSYVKQQYENQNWNFIKNYHLLRFEDLASKPWQEMESLYNFLGFPEDENLKTWVKKQQEKVSLKFGKMQKKYDRVKSYNTDRDNPYFTAQAWRLSMPWTEVELVQRQCQSFMDVFRYRKFETIDDQKNMDRYIALPLNRSVILR